MHGMGWCVEQCCGSTVPVPTWPIGHGNQLPWHPLHVLPVCVLCTLAKLHQWALLGLSTDVTSKLKKSVVDSVVQQ